MKKTNKNFKKAIALGLCGALLASVGIGAYLTDTDVKSDVYTVGNVQAEIVSNGDMEVANAGYLIPGTVHTYERAATNTGINDAYVFMSITIPYEMVGVSDANGTQLGEFIRQIFIPGSADGNAINAEWKLVDAGYIGQYEIEANGQACGEHDTHSLVYGDTITYVYGYIGDNTDGSLKALASGETTSNIVDIMELTNLYNASKINGEVSTKLYAIQSANVNGGLTDVNGVWAVINNTLMEIDTTVTFSVNDDAIDFEKYSNHPEFFGWPENVAYSVRAEDASYTIKLTNVNTGEKYNVNGRAGEAIEEEIPNGTYTVNKVLLSCEIMAFDENFNELRAQLPVSVYSDVDTITIDNRNREFNFTVFDEEWQEVTLLDNEAYIFDPENGGKFPTSYSISIGGYYAELSANRVSMGETALMDIPNGTYLTSVTINFDDGSTRLVEIGDVVIDDTTKANGITLEIPASN